MSLKKKTYVYPRPPMWYTWCHMRSRCNNPNDKDYKNYGARNIKVCDRWLTFKNFYEDMLPTWKVGMTIERINNEGNYKPSNCKWIPRSEQSTNRRGVKRFYGKTLPEWSKELGINRSTLEMRYYSYGWSIDKTLETPVNKKVRIEI